MWGRGLTLFLKPCDVHQGSILGPLQEVLQALQAGFEADLSCGQHPGFSQLLAVPGAALQKPHQDAQQGAAQANALLGFTVAAGGRQKSGEVSD